MKKTFDFDFGNGEFVMKDGNPVILSGITLSGEPTATISLPRTATHPA